MLNLDTHILLLFLDEALTDRERNAIITEGAAISDIVLWELAKLQQKGRASLDLESALFRSFLQNLTVYPITPEIARTSTQLDFSSDLADEIIAATSIVEKIPLLTRDRRIRKSRMVPFAL
jgi:PIN domain nuclease of toxin-antitoxin system